MTSYQSLADIASSKGDSVDDPNLSSGKYTHCISLLFIYDLFYLVPLVLVYMYFRVLCSVMPVFFCV